MTNAHFPLATSRTATLMETIMKPLSFAGRPARWLMAAGLALAAMQGLPARAQPAAELPEGLDLDPGPTHPRPGEAEPFFTKTGEQLNCDYVRYTLRFGAQGDPAKFLDPAFTADLQNVRLDFRDTLPAGLEIVDVQVSGDGTAAGGGAMPAPSISTTTNPNDTVKIDDFRLSTSDLDGSGEIDRRYIDFVITAKIDHAAFPAPTLVENQGFVGIILVGGPAIMAVSHDPALPDDGDFKTGEPTKILIDVTRCDRPPPPPPGEECFEVENGTVDCVPGGGAFIYHMPVGPELGGKWVQLRTTTPGVDVAPLSQLAPIGGGVLNWTITGALPGDVVHLVVTGVEIYAGPEEGLGLCCSQTVEIVIPEDLECPPGGEPDIKVEKRADVAQCTPEGGCDFTIRVTNVGDAPYNGPIVLDEVTTPGNAAVVSGPSGSWVCVPMVSPMSCTHPATTLNPGEWVELKLGFAPGPGWDWNVIRNCAEYDYTASGKPEVFGSTANDKACASIPICRRGDPRCDPPVEKKVDLRITKDPRSVSCTADGVCWFNIRVFNNGDENYVGPLTVVDEYPTGVPAASTFGPNPPWACGPIGGGQFQCDHPGVNLAPGAFIPIWVRAVVNDDYQGDIIRNCAEVAAIPGETDLANNRACAQMRIPNRDPGQPALRILKTCEGPADLGAPATCRITVTNAGTAAPTGPVRVADAATVIGSGAPVQILTVTPDGGEWACGPVPANALSCQIPGAVMTPGTSRHFDVTVQVPTYGRFENCARGSWGPAPGNDIVYPFGEACAEGGYQVQPVNVEKTGDKECEVGKPCTFEITITNGGTTGFSGPVRIGDAIGVGGTRLEGVEITEISPPFGCSPEPTTLPMSCVATLSLGPGESRVHQVTVVIPEGGPLANIREPVSARNCVGVVPPDTPVAAAERMMSTAPETTGRPGTQPFACHTFTIADKVEECSQGFVMNDAGRCVCPEGTTFRNGQCRTLDGGTPPPPPPPPPVVDRCVLLPGQIRTQDGRCVCPRGTDLIRGECRKAPPPQCKLLPGQIRTQDGRCICPRGTSLVRGECRKDQPPQCRLLPGQIRTQDGRCICPRGTSLVRGECRKDQPPQCKLLPGQIRTQDGRCVCPRGTSLVRGECRKNPPPQCKLLPGQIRTEDGRCVCPRGTSLIRGQCRKVERECPRGTVLRNGRCVTIQIEACPRGFVGTPPNCRRIQIDPKLKQLVDPKQRQQLQQQKPQIQ
jgi:hypothetical protein